MKLKERKLNRAKHRFIAGSEQGSADKYLFVTLTTPEGKEIDIHRAWRLFRLRLARKGIKPEYYVVRELNKIKTCTHLHAVLRVAFIQSDLVRSAWIKAVSASSEEEISFCWTHNKRMYGSIGKRCWYVSKYLTKSLEERAGFWGINNRYFWYSNDWIVKGWTKVARGLFWLGRGLDNMDIDIIRRGYPAVLLIYRSLERLRSYGMYLDERKLNLGIDILENAIPNKSCNIVQIKLI